MPPWEAQSKANAEFDSHFSLFFFFFKADVLLGFLSVAKTDPNPGLLQKQSHLRQTSEKWGIPVTPSIFRMGKQRVRKTRSLALNTQRAKT